MQVFAYTTKAMKWFLLSNRGHTTLGNISHPSLLTFSVILWKLWVVHWTSQYVWMTILVLLTFVRFTSVKGTLFLFNIDQIWMKCQRFWQILTWWSVCIFGTVYRSMQFYSAIMWLICTISSTGYHVFKVIYTLPFNSFCFKPKLNFRTYIWIDFVYNTRENGRFTRDLF